MAGNWLKTGILMAAITALFGGVGALIGGRQGMLVALAFGAATNLWAYWFSDTMVLKLYRAQEVDERSATALFGIVKELAGRAGVPMPRVYTIDEPQPNAFATGRNPEHAAIAATTSILNLLSPRELRGVLGHELARTSSIATFSPRRSPRRLPAPSRRWPSSACFSAAAITTTAIRWSRSWC